MSSDQIAIRVANLGKCYQIYDRPQDRLKQSLVPRLRRLLGQPAPDYYREFWALRDVSFEVRKGETIGIIGRNGSGKSTLLQIICGTLTPTTGTVETAGRVAALLELGSGFNPEFTGRENVYLNGSVLGLSRDEIDARFDAIAAFAEIGEFIEQPVKTYSSGMVVRLAFAVQAMVDPDILIVDEALAVGDEKFQRKCFSRLEDLKSRGTSILFVSHSGPQIVELCERALLLESGMRLLCAGPMQIIRAYQQLIYAPQDKQQHLVREYQAADCASIDDVGVNETMSEAVEPSVSDEIFDASLVPETTTAYPIQGAEILSIRIENDDGLVVNLLQPSKDYLFRMSGRFLSNVNGVYFGIHLRSISGVVITGQQYPEQGAYLETIVAGVSFEVSFHFKMCLLPGVYFAGGGVWSCQQETCHHRILDALMFRVVPYGPQQSFGYCDASSSKPTIELY